MTINVSNNELCTVREAMRELNRMIERLEAREVEKFVLAKQNRMRAVVLSLDEYVALRREAAQAPHAAAA